MSKPIQRHLFLIEVQTDEQVSDLKNVVTGRLHSKQGFVGTPRGWPVRVVGTLPAEPDVVLSGHEPLLVHVGDAPPTESKFTGLEGMQIWQVEQAVERLLQLGYKWFEGDEQTPGSWRYDFDHLKNGT